MSPSAQESELDPEAVAELERAEAEVAAEAERPPASLRRRALGWVLKLGLLGLVFFWLARNQSFKVSDLTGLLRSPWTFYAFLLMWPSIFFCALRYHLLLKVLGFNAPLREVFSLNMIGMFFDMVAPLSNGGDLAKVVYLGRLHGKERLPLLLFSAILDRVLGLFALFMFALMVCIFAREQILQNPELRQLARVLSLVCFCFICAFFVFASKRMEHSALRKRIMHVLPFHQQFERVYAGFAGLRRHLGLLAWMLVLSMLNHLFSCLSILCLANTMQFTDKATGLPAGLDTTSALVVLPLGLFLNTFGIAGGFGAGEAAFEALFALTLKLKGGAQLALNFHLVQIVPKLLGFPFLLTFRRRASKVEAASGDPAPTLRT